MNGFVKINDEFISRDMISSIKKGNGSFFEVLLKDNTGRTVHGTWTDFIDNSNEIAQVIPVVVPTFALYETEGITADGQIVGTEEPIHYLALVGSGDMRPLILTGEIYEFADDIGGYLGMREG